MIVSSLALLLSLGLAVQDSTLQRTTLWQIGKPDGKAAEFGLAPGGYDRYSTDPVFLAGRSATSDWPYVLPGPDDRWARSVSHRSEVVFGLGDVPKRLSGKTAARLVIDLAETHPITPPLLTVLVNGTRIAQWQTPKGASDSLILGNAATGRAARWVVELPASALRSGNNTISLVNDRGSWVVYDALRLEATEGLNAAPLRDEITITAKPSRQAILRTPQGPRQPISLEVLNVGPAVQAAFRIGDVAEKADLRPGRQEIELSIAAVKRPREVQVTLAAGELRAKATARLAPVRPWTVYLFPHSHVDVGYTDQQDRVIQMHERNFTDALAVARASREHPHESRFRFNVESTWVLESYLAKATPAERDELIASIKNGTIAVSNGFGNLLTGMMHPEELMQSFRYAHLLHQRHGLPLGTVSQTDVPGVTWGTVTALRHAGVNNLVLMPNTGDRVGGIHRAWRDRPFWWVDPSGRDRILVWQTDPYSVGHGARWNGDRSQPIRTADPTAHFIGDFVWAKLDRLAEQNYPYDLIGEPWSAQDNAPIDADVAVAAKLWNERYVTPRVVVSTLADASAELRRRYGSKLPVVKGDYTPYWEDGIGSTAAETASNRTTPNRLIQAETLYAMSSPGQYPAEEFLEAWRNTLLFSEHTWGAWNSVWNPDDPAAQAQWTIKRAFATRAEQSSRQLLERALGTAHGTEVSVVNTSSWVRSDLVRLTPAQSRSGDRVEDASGRPLPSQRLKTGELAVLVQDVPPLSSKRLRVLSGSAYQPPGITVGEAELQSDEYRVRLDPATGAIVSLLDKKRGREVAASPLNSYLYLPGSDLKALKGNGRPKIEIVEAGPLVATLRASSSAPGTRGLTQEVTLTAGLDRIEVTNTLDKLPIREKEGVHFAFPFAVKNGRMRIGGAWSTIEPERDQIAGSNKNWFTSQTFVDVSDESFGVTWSSLDAPLIEVGEISATLLGSVWDPDLWRQEVDPTSTLYSWALNNHWHTNYKADQQGLLRFRYVLQTHGAYAPDAAFRFGTAAREPLLVGPAATPEESLFTISDPTVVASRVVPSDDGHALIVRLFGTSSETRRVTIKLRSGLGAVSETDLSQRRGRTVRNIEVPGHGVRTLRIERLRR